MITGFNTDVKHDGVTYHVQTEDKGLQSPLILTLVYHGGAILAARRTPYDDLIAEGFRESALTERLGRQHKLICAAIKAGRLKDLQRKFQPQVETRSEGKPADVNQNLSSRNPLAQDSNSPLDLPAPNPDHTLSPTASLIELSLEPPPVETPAQPPAPISNIVQPPTVRIVKAGIADFARVAEDNMNLPRLTLLDEPHLRAGEEIKLRVHIYDDAGNHRKFAGVPVKVKIIGTAFRPVQHQANANSDGIATFDLHLPPFKSGRAVLLVTAGIGDYELELRRIIQQSA